MIKIPIIFSRLLLTSFIWVLLKIKINFWRLKLIFEDLASLFSQCRWSWSKPHKHISRLHWRGHWWSAEDFSSLGRPFWFLVICVETPQVIIVVMVKFTKQKSSGGSKDQSQSRRNAEEVSAVLALIGCELPFFFFFFLFLLTDC